MEILLWLVPAAVATLVAMAWVSWVGRDPGVQTERDRDRAQQRMAQALSTPAIGAGPARPRERSTGVAVRPSEARRSRGNAA